MGPFSGSLLHIAADIVGIAPDIVGYWELATGDAQFVH